MSNFDEYGLDDTYDRVYSHNEVMEALNNKLASMALPSQPIENSELLNKVAADNREITQRVNQLSSAEVENERLRAKVLELENKLSGVNVQLATLNNQVTPVYNHYQNDVNGQIELLKIFLKSHCRTVLGSRISAKELNEKVYAFSLKKGIPIKKTEVKSLVTAEPFNLGWYTSTGGIASYRDLEFIPVDLNQAQRSNLPSLQSSANSPRTGATSPAPVMMSRQTS